MHERFSHQGRCAPHGPREHRRHAYGRRFGRGGPRARRGDIRAAVLALLGEREMHGYEMIQELEERSGGVWRPSAGSISPTLQLLEDEGLIKGQESDGKRRFELTEQGREQASERQGPLPWEAVNAGADREEVRLGNSFRQLAGAFQQVARAGSQEQQARASELLDEARKSIYGILAETE